MPNRNIARRPINRRWAR